MAASQGRIENHIAVGPGADRVDALSRAAIETRYPDNWREVAESEMREMMSLSDEAASILRPRLPTVD